MRNLFLLLLLANLALWAWQRWFSPSPDPEQSVQQEQNDLVLVSEAPPEATDLATPVDATPTESAESSSPGERSQENAPEQVAAVSAPRRCLSVGPYRDLSEAATAAAGLKSSGLDPRQRVAQGDIWVGYWVHIPELNSRERANEVLAALKENGVTDSYISVGDEGPLISLGVFSEIKRAGRRREEVKRLGFNPVVTDRSRQGTVYWVDVDLPEGEETLDMERFQTKPGRIVRLVERPCGAAS